MTSASVFSYLAATHTLHVAEYPRINYGTEVEKTDRFLAGDGPLVAGMLTAFGHDATLHSNPVADDQDGTPSAVSSANGGSAARSLTRMQARRG